MSLNEVSSLAGADHFTITRFNECFYFLNRQLSHNPPLVVYDLGEYHFTHHVNHQLVVVNSVLKNIVVESYLV